MVARSRRSDGIYHHRMRAKQSKGLGSAVAVALFLFIVRLISTYLVTLFNSAIFNNGGRFGHQQRDFGAMLPRQDELGKKGNTVALSEVENLPKPKSRPHHAQVKVETMQQLNDGTFVAKSKQRPDGGAFVHIGKTGGSTLSTLFRNGCHSFMPHPCRADIRHESIASQLVESYYHVPDFAFLQQSHHTFYLVTCRDPFDRTISAFVFEHVQNRSARNEMLDKIKRQKYNDAYACFPTLQIFVDFLGNDPTTFSYPYKKNHVIANSCPDLARAALSGRVKIYNHFYFSFQRIVSFIPEVEKQAIYSVRQEHLWRDWKTVNEMLGQREPIYIPEEANWKRDMADLEVKHLLPVTRELNASGVALLCNALKDEYLAYFRFLKLAKNLTPEDLHQSIAHAKKNCPSLDVDDLVQRA